MPRRKVPREIIGCAHNGLRCITRAIKSASKLRDNDSAR